MCDGILGGRVKAKENVSWRRVAYTVTGASRYVIFFFPPMDGMRPPRSVRTVKKRSLMTI